MTGGLICVMPRLTGQTEATSVFKVLSKGLKPASSISLISLRHLHHNHHQQYKWWLLKKCLDDSINILPCFAAGQALCFYFHNLSQIQIIVLFVVFRFNLYSMLTGSRAKHSVTSGSK